MRFVEAAIEGLESLSPEMIEAELPDDSGGKYSLDDLPDDSGGEMANLGLSPEERAQFQQESGWSDQIMDSLRSPEEYRIYENAGLQEREVNGRRCLVRDDIDLEQVDEDGFTNADLMSRGGRSPLAPNGGEKSSCITSDSVKILHWQNYHRPNIEGLPTILFYIRKGRIPVLIGPPCGYRKTGTLGNTF